MEMENINLIEMRENGAALFAAETPVTELSTQQKRELMVYLYLVKEWTQTAIAKHLKVNNRQFVNKPLNEMGIGQKHLSRDPRKPRANREHPILGNKEMLRWELSRCLSITDLGKTCGVSREVAMDWINYGKLGNLIDRTAMVRRRFWSRVDKSGGPDACWPYTGSLTPAGYASTCKRLHPSRMGHRFAYESEYGPLPVLGVDGCIETPCIMHICDNPACQNPRHLRCATHRENMLDREIKKRGNHKQRFSKGEILWIRQQVAEGLMNKSAICRLFKVCYHSVQRIVSKKSYKEIE